MSAGIDQSLPAIAPAGAFGVKNCSRQFFRTLDTLLTYAGFDQRHPAFDPECAFGVKMCSRHIFQDQARYKRKGGFGGLKVIDINLINEAVKTCSRKW